MDRVSIDRIKSEANKMDVQDIGDKLYLEKSILIIVFLA